MHYNYVAIPDNEVPRAALPAFQHVVSTYASEVNQTVRVWRSVPADLLDFKPQFAGRGPPGGDLKSRAVCHFFIHSGTPLEDRQCCVPFP